MLVECVPNFSEGRNEAVLRELRQAIESVPSVRLLDVQSDRDHNRSVFTFVAPPEAALDAAMGAVRVAAARINLTEHRGEHPRMGAADVVPFIPIEGVTMDDCVALARRLGERIGAELEIPVFLYGRAAARPGRERLPDVRKGEFEGLRDLIGSDPSRDPDYGPRRIHPTAGATAVGARPFLVAYNIYLEGGDEALARAIAKKVRASSGGLPAVQAMGITVGGEPQVSMNLTDIDTTALHLAYQTVAAEARAAGAGVAWSEIVGLVPERAILAAAGASLRLRDDVAGHLVEAKLRAGAGPSLAGFLDSVASSSPAPGGGTVAAIAGALAAALAAMVGRLSVGKKKYAALEQEFRALIGAAEDLRGRLARLADEDAAAYGAVMAAYGIPRDRATERAAAIEAAMLAAAEVPLRTMEAARDAAALCARAAAAGNTNARPDAGVGALLAGVAARGAWYNVMINVSGLADPAAGSGLIERSRTLLAEAEEHAAAARRTVEGSFGG
jgi:glutamate formiminotransferase/formiminotetrahydrofolate cyclodeaminase